MKRDPRRDIMWMFLTCLLSPAAGLLIGYGYGTDSIGWILLGGLFFVIMLWAGTVLLLMSLIDFEIFDVTNMMRLIDARIAVLEKIETDQATFAFDLRDKIKIKNLPPDYYQG